MPDQNNPISFVFPSSISSVFSFVLLPFVIGITIFVWQCHRIRNVFVCLCGCECDRKMANKNMHDWKHCSWPKYSNKTAAKEKWLLKHYRCDTNGTWNAENGNRVDPVSGADSKWKTLCEFETESKRKKEKLRREQVFPIQTPEHVSNGTHTHMRERSFTWR